MRALWRSSPSWSLSSRRSIRCIGRSGRDADRGRARRRGGAASADAGSVDSAAILRSIELHDDMIAARFGMDGLIRDSHWAAGPVARHH